MPGRRKTRELLLVNSIGERLSSTGAPYPVETGAAANVTDSTVRRGPRFSLDVLQTLRRFSENDTIFPCREFQLTS
ncbi:hypothetical protein WN51_13432 [Melipona quadrifasciata]|uniref:Uncharacterized protein n=1 Tax=Melipona quadrifasciata TaxID=166423 RepID=A0A0N0U5F3_9HYME|nr:hypothetical protein WN51_13432 [Melipona quadrifasciata]